MVSFFTSFEVLVPPNFAHVRCPWTNQGEDVRTELELSLQRLIGFPLPIS